MLKKLNIYYLFVSLPFVLLLLGSAIFYDAIKSTIIRNPHPQINYTIFAIILVGGVFILLNSRRLVREARDLVGFSRAVDAKTDSTSLQELTNRYSGDLSCILQMVASTGDRSISHQEQAALEHELTNTRSRLVRRNALPQYLTGLLVGMGLLGTFIGLLATLQDISILISSFADLDMKTVSPIEVFRVMIERMKAPMQSMAIAFSASMFGLLGSIILGLMMVGIRRLQGDIFSLLSSQVARHIETALSFESISFRGSEATSDGGASDLTAKILLRIEERLAEAGRLRQRALTAEIDDFKQQRADMLRVLAEQTEASNNFRTELQQLGGQLGAIVAGMEKRSSAMAAQLSDLTVALAGDAKETHKLLAMQLAEQQQLKDTLDGYNIEERLAEAARAQQRMFSAEIDDFKQQRVEMLQALTAQTEASSNVRVELQQIGGQLAEMFSRLGKGSDEISAQLSELTVHLAADAKETHRLLNITSNNVRGELQQLDNHLGRLREANEQGYDKVCSRLAEFMAQADAEASDAGQRLAALNGDMRGELQQLGGLLAGLNETTRQGAGEVVAQLSGLMGQLANEAQAAQQRLEQGGAELRSQLQQIGGQLGSICDVTQQGAGDLATKVSGLMVQLTSDAKESHQRLDKASSEVRTELQQLGSQLGTIFNVTEKGHDQICTRIAEMVTRMTAEAAEPQPVSAE